MPRTKQGNFGTNPMQEVHTESSSYNSIFAFTALRPRLAPEGRWYTNAPVALKDLWHRHPGPWLSFPTQPTQLRRDSGKPSRFWRRRLRYHASISPSLD